MHSQHGLIGKQDLPAGAVNDVGHDRTGADVVFRIEQTADFTSFNIQLIELWIFRRSKRFVFGREENRLPPAPADLADPHPPLFDQPPALIRNQIQAD